MDFMKKMSDKMTPKPFSMSGKLSEIMGRIPQTVPPAPSPPYQGPVGTLTGGEGVGGNVNQYGIERPDFFSPYDTEANTMNPNFVAANPANIGAQNVSFTGPDLSGMTGFQAMQKRALSTEESPWLAMQKQANQQNMMRDLDAMAMQQSGAQADARSQLAMRGGMSTGARERLARGGARDALRASQGIYGQRSDQDLSAGMSDDQMKMALLGKTAGIEADIGKFTSAGNLDASKTNASNTLKSDMFNTTADMGTDRFNIGNQIGSVNSSNANALGVYSEDMQAWAAQQLAKSMGGGGGGNPGGPTDPTKVNPGIDKGGGGPGSFQTAPKTAQNTGGGNTPDYTRIAGGKVKIPEWMKPENMTMSTGGGGNVIQKAFGLG